MSEDQTDIEAIGDDDAEDAVVVARRKAYIHYSEELAKTIADRLSEGMALAVQCRRFRRTMPHQRTLHRWIVEHPEFRDLLDQAYETFADQTFSEMAEIEQKILRGDIEPAAGAVVLGNQRWRLVTMARKRFGNQGDGNGNGGMAINIQVVTGITRAPGDLIDAEIVGKSGESLETVAGQVPQICGEDAGTDSAEAGN